MKKLKFLFITTLAISTLFLTSCGDDNAGPSVNSITVSGTVSDDIGNTLEGANVTSEADDTNSTTTGADGTFSISVEETDQLTFSADGYSSATLAAADVVDVVLDRGSGAFFAESFDANNNSVADPVFAANSIQPTADLGTVTAAAAPLEDVNYRGAVDPSGTPWYEGWSFYSNLVAGEVNSDPINLPTNVLTITDADMPATPGMSVTWTNDNLYVLSGLVFVSEGVTLNIQAGTVIQSMPGEAENSTALVIARGGKINAMGTAAEPIIFTYQGDNGNSPANLRGQWGGLIILGQASLNSSPGFSAIEGIPTNEARGIYGGSDDTDNSGVLSYVSIRHGGTLLGGDNEINGLTLGGVGSGTTIEYVEVIGNRDDGIEWFGGTVGGDHLITAFCADDALDYDEGYRGMNQFVIVHQDSEEGAADRGGEHDGGTDPETGNPFATPEFWNVTSIGNAGSRALTFRDNAGGEYNNSIFVGYGRGVDIEDLENQNQDSFTMWEDDLLSLTTNTFWNIGAGDRSNDIFKVSN